MTHLMMMVCGFVKLMSLLHPCCSNMRPSSDAGVAYTQGVFCFSRGVVVVCLNNYSPSAPTGQTSAPIGPMQLPAATFGGKTLTNILDPTVCIAIHSRGVLLFIRFLLSIIVDVCAVSTHVLPPATHPLPLLGTLLVSIVHGLMTSVYCSSHFTPTFAGHPPSHPSPPQVPKQQSYCLISCLSLHVHKPALPASCTLGTSSMCRPHTCPACILHRTSSMCRRTAQQITTIQEATDGRRYTSCSTPYRYRHSKQPRFFKSM